MIAMTGKDRVAQERCQTDHHRGREKEGGDRKPPSSSKDEEQDSDDHGKYGRADVQKVHDKSLLECSSRTVIPVTLLFQETNGNREHWPP